MLDGEEKGKDVPGTGEMQSRGQVGHQRREGEKEKEKSGGLRK